MASKTPMVRFISLVALVLVLAIAPAAVAARGGNGHGASISFSSPSGTFASTSGVSVGQQYQVIGSGFAPNTWVTVGAHYSDMTWWSCGITDGQGNISLTLTATSAGQIYHEAKEMAPSDKLILKASATLSVNP